MARTPRFTTTQMIEAAREEHGMVYLVAERLRCSHVTVYNYQKRHPSVREAFELERNRMVDVAEQKLYEAIQRGESWAIALMLKTKGKDRGYVERQETTGKDGDAIAYNEVTESAREKLKQKMASMALRYAQDAPNGHA